MSSNDLYYLFIYDFDNQIGFGTTPPSAAPNIEEACERIAHNLDRKMEDQDRRSVHKDQYVFHAMKQEGVVLLCVSGINSSKRIVFGLLENVADDPDFDPVGMGTKRGERYLQRQLDIYDDPENDEVARCRTKINDIKEVMVENIDKIFENMMKTEELVQQAEEMADTGLDFRQRGRGLQNAEVKKMIVIGLIVILLIVGILCVLCVVIIAGTGVLGLIIGLVVDSAKDESSTKEENGVMGTAAASFYLLLVLIISFIL